LRFGRDRRLRKRAEFLRIQAAGSGGRRVSTRHYVLLVAARPLASEPRARAPKKPGARAGDVGAETEANAAGRRDAGAAAAAHAERPPSRIGIVVTRKVGNAVARNRIKRVCRECFRQWPDLLPPGVDLVVIARQGADALGLAEARAEWLAVERVLRRRAEEALAQQASMPHVSAGSPPIPSPSPARDRPKPGPRGQRE
jgi:ribonuclease P protein component